MSKEVGSSGAADHCALEADHLHNLPQLLRSYAPELLHYYWEVEIPSFRSRAEALKLDVGHFESLWRQLHPLVEVSMRNDLALTK